jgi:hypothetical protein
VGERLVAAGGFISKSAVGRAGRAVGGAVGGAASFAAGKVQEVASFVGSGAQRIGTKIATSGFGQAVGKAGQAIGRTASKYGQAIGTDIGGLAGNIGTTMGALGKSVGESVLLGDNPIGKFLQYHSAMGKKERLDKEESTLHKLYEAKYDITGTGHKQIGMAIDKERAARALEEKYDTTHPAVVKARAEADAARAGLASVGFKDPRGDIFRELMSLDASGSDRDHKEMDKLIYKNVSHSPDRNAMGGRARAYAEEQASDVSGQLQSVPRLGELLNSTVGAALGNALKANNLSAVGQEISNIIASGPGTGVSPATIRALTDLSASLGAVRGDSSQQGQGITAAERANNDTAAIVMAAMQKTAASALGKEMDKLGQEFATNSKNITDAIREGNMYKGNNQMASAMSLAPEDFAAMLKSMSEGKDLSAVSVTLPDGAVTNQAAQFAQAVAKLQGLTVQQAGGEENFKAMKEMLRGAISLNSNQSTVTVKMENIQNQASSLNAAASNTLKNISTQPSAAGAGGGSVINRGPAGPTGRPGTGGT